MKYIRDVWRVLLIEPSTWLFYCFLWPSKLREDLKQYHPLARVLPCLRLALPLFLVSYPIAVILKIAFSIFSLSLVPPIEPLLFTIALHITVIVITCTLVSIIGDVVTGTVIGIAMGIMAGFAWPTIASVGLGVGLAYIIVRSRNTIVSFASTIIVGTSLLSNVSSLIWYNGEIAVFEVAGIAAILFFIMGNVKWIASKSYILAYQICALVVLLVVIIALKTTVDSSIWHITTYVVFGIMVFTASLHLLIGGMRYITSGSDTSRVAVAKSHIFIEVPVCAIAIVNLIIILIIPNAIINPISLIFEDISLVVPFSISYLFIYYRFPLYPFSSFSMIRAYLASREDPAQVFTYLHRSSLYWDELTTLPLPYLKQIILFAAKHDIERATLEIRFIATQRTGQRHAARIALIEIIISVLEDQTSLSEIALAWERIAKFLSSEDAHRLDPQWHPGIPPWFALLTLLSDASRDAARASSPLGRQAKLKALEAMLRTLKGLNPKNSFKDARLENRLNNIIRTWTTTAQRELEQLENAPEKTEYHDNPFTPGLVLRSQDTSFVGRRDIVQQLSKALDRTGRRPTLLLYGERRMGKSSLLSQLPNLLGASYLPIFYNLQDPGMVSSTHAFLSTLAREILQAMDERGMKIAQLERKEIKRENEAASYQAFDKWLDSVELVLEKKERTVLLLFDEYDRLEEIDRTRAMNIDLLLDWLRGTIQNRSRIAFLFCGVQTLGELGSHWVKRFVNVQTLKVSFLSLEEARQLIIHPVSDYSSQKIFDEMVVNKIMDVTGCHPFLIQAVCSQMIDELNTTGRKRAELQDVTFAVTVVADAWDAYFQDMWRRSDQQQKLCLTLLLLLSNGSIQQLVVRSNLGERTIRNALQKLHQRDLLLLENGLYRISTAIFREWMGQTLYEDEQWLQIIDSNKDLFQSVLRQTLFSKGVVTASAFPGIPLTYIERLFQQYVQEHPNADVEYQEQIHSLILSSRIKIVAQRMSLQLEAIISTNYNNGVSQKFEHQIHELFQIFSLSLGFDTVYKQVSNDFVTFLLHAESAFENMRVPFPLPILVCPHRNISHQIIDDIRHLLQSGKFGPDKKMAILLLFCENEKLSLVRQLLTKTLRAIYAQDIVVINQDDLFDLVFARDTRRALRHLVLSQISLTAVDPYIITGPTPVHFFFGRESQLREITDHVITTSYAITGGRRIGKTSVVSCLHHSRLPARGFRTLYQDCSIISSYEAFLATSTRDWQPEPPTPALTTFGDLLDSPPLDKPFVLLLDEADKLVPEDRKNGWRIFNTLRALANAKNIQVIFSGERTLREALKDPSSPLFNFANEMLLGPLDFPAVEELVTRPLKQLEIEIQDEASVVHHIYELTSGHPNIVQRFCRRLVDRLNEQGIRRITLEDVIAVTNDPGFQEKDFLQTYWEAATPLEKIITLVLSQNVGTRGLQEIHQLVCERTPVQPRIRETKEALERLVDLRSLLKHSQVGYTFAVAAFPRVLVHTTTVADLLSVLVEEYSELEQKR